MPRRRPRRRVECLAFTTKRSTLVASSASARLPPEISWRDGEILRPCDRSRESRPTCGRALRMTSGGSDDPSRRGSFRTRETADEDSVDQRLRGDRDSGIRGANPTPPSASNAVILSVRPRWIHPRADDGRTEGSSRGRHRARARKRPTDAKAASLVVASKAALLRRSDRPPWHPRHRRGFRRRHRGVRGEILRPCDRSCESRRTCGRALRMTSGGSDDPPSTGGRSRRSVTDRGTGEHHPKTSLTGTGARREP